MSERRGHSEETHSGAVHRVPPLALARPHEVFIDEDLVPLEAVSAAGGTPHPVSPNTGFPIAGTEPLPIAGGRIARVRAER